MAIMVSGSNTNYTPAPEGVHNAVCADVQELGTVETSFGPKEKIRIVWQLEATMDTGKPYSIGKRYTPSLHEKATLYKDLKAWRGKPFTHEEIKAFDLEKLIGASCQLVVAHDTKDGEEFAYVTAILKPTKKLTVSPDFVRLKDRPDQEIPATKNEQPTATPADDDMAF